MKGQGGLWMQSTPHRPVAWFTEKVRRGRGELVQGSARDGSRGQSSQEFMGHTQNIVFIMLDVTAATEGTLRLDMV